MSAEDFDIRGTKSYGRTRPRRAVRWLGTFVFCALATAMQAFGASFSYTGDFFQDDNNQVFSFTIAAPGSVVVRTFSYAGGVNSAGISIPRGGFDTTVSLFDASGNLLMFNRDGGCGAVAADAVTAYCFDAYLSAPLPAGTYQVVLTQSENTPNGPTLADSFVYNGQGSFTAAPAGLAPGFWDFFPNQRNGAWALDIQGADAAQATTATTLTSSLNPSTFAQPITLTATVSLAAATGNVTFMDGTTTLATVPVSGGSAVLNIASLSAGMHALTASYSGDANNAGSVSSALTQQVNQAAPAITVSSSLNPSSFGQNVVFTATVTPAAATGMVTFSDGATVLGSFVLAGGTAAFGTAGLTAGIHSVTASYAGDANDMAGSSMALAQTVNLAVTSVSLTASPNPVIVGQFLSMQASVTPAGATGMVTFRNGAAVLGSRAVNGGTASLSVPVAFGTYALTAAYSGDANNAASVSATVNVAANYPPLNITTVSLPSGTAGQPYASTGLTVTGGSGSFIWSATGLPAGLSLSSLGQVSGTPSAAFGGTVAFTVTDTVSQLTASASYSLTIAVAPLTISGPAGLGSVAAGAPVSAVFSATGGTAPYSWSVSGAANIAVDANGHITGTPTTPGVYTVLLAVTDANKTSANQSLSLSVFGIASGPLPPATTTTAYSATITLAGGAKPYTITASGLPAGITFAGTAFGGAPTTPGSYNVTVQASDAAGLKVSATYTLSVTGPAPLTIFTTSLDDATAGQPYSQNLSATGGTTPYTWSQSGGVLPAGLSLSSAGGVTGMATVPGPYNLGVRVTDASGNTVVGTVSINVDPAPLEITNGAAFPAGIAGTQYPSQTLAASGGMPPYTFGVEGSLPAGLSLSNSQIVGTPATAGNNNFTLTVADSSTPPLTGLLGVSLAIRPASADLVLASASVPFSITAGTSTPPSASSVGISSSVVSQSITFTTASSVPWLTVSGGSTTPGVVSIGLNNAALALTTAGSPYTGGVVVTCSSGTCAGNAQTIGVTLTVTAPPPLLTLGENLFSFAALTSQPQASTASLSILNTGGGSLQINSVTSDSPWLTLGTPPASIMPGPGGPVNLTADPTGLAAGYYRGTISVSSSGGSATAVVALFVSAAATMTLGPAGTQFSLPLGGALGNASGSFGVDASTGATVPYTSTVIGAPWLSITNGGSGTATPGVAGTIGYSIDPTAAATLPAGAYYGTIQVAGSGVVNSPQDFQVVLDVTPDNTPVVPDPEPAGLVFVSAGSGAPPAQTINVYASSRNPLPFQASASVVTGNWLSISSSTGSALAGAPGAIIVNADPTGLAAGAYRGLVSFASASTVIAVNVTLIVEPPLSSVGSAARPASGSTSANPAASAPACANAQLVPTETGLVSNFSTPAAWPIPLAVQLFDTCGSAVANARVSASFNSGDPVLPLTASTPGGNLYVGTWTPRNPSSHVTITASVNAAGYPAASVQIAGQALPNTAPVLAPNGVGDIFNPEVGAGLGPGNIIQIYGSGLASMASTPGVLPLPTAVLGTSVLIGGVTAPLFYVSPVQINAQIPFELAAGGQYQLVVSANGALTTPLPIQLNAGAPAILDFSSGAVVAQHLDGTLVTAAAPAAPGEYLVIYSSGLGATDIPVPSGTASPLNPLANVADPPVVTLNGNPINVLFAGLAPGLVGLFQINIQVPAGLATGNYNLLLTQSTAVSNTTVLPVQQQ